MLIYICLYTQKDDALLQKQEATLRHLTDADDERLDDKPSNNPTSSRPTFHRPFLDVEDSLPPEKLYKLHCSEVQNGMCAVPVNTGPSATVAQKTPLCSSNLKSSGNMTEVSSHCESSQLDDGDCRDVKDEDVGRERRLNAALGLISLADVSSDVAQIKPTSSTETTTGNCCNV